MKLSSIHAAAVAVGLSAAAVGWYAGARPQEAAPVSVASPVAQSSFDIASSRPAGPAASTPAAPVPVRAERLPTAPPVVLASRLGMAVAPPERARLVGWSSTLAPGAQRAADRDRTLAYVVEQAAPDTVPELEEQSLVPGLQPQFAAVGLAESAVEAAVERGLLRGAPSEASVSPELGYDPETAALLPKEPVTEFGMGQIAVGGDILFTVKRSTTRLRAGQCPPGTKNEGCRCVDFSHQNAVLAVNPPPYCNDPGIQAELHGSFPDYAVALQKKLTR